jgi:hypothetical protein
MDLLHFGLWGGLNDVMRNREVSIGLRYNTFAFGDISTSSSIDARASKQRKQTQIGYALSNRNYTHRMTFYHGTGISKKGCTLFLLVVLEVLMKLMYCTYYNGYSYYFGVDKRLGQRHLLSLAAFAAPTESGRQGSAINEMRTITGDNYYNPSWGMQNGKKEMPMLQKAINQQLF